MWLGSGESLLRGCKLQTSLVSHMVGREREWRMRRQGESMKAVMENGRERGETEVEEREVGETKTETDREKENTSSKRP